MTNKWKLVFAVAMAIMILLVLPFAGRLFLPYGEYGMMTYGYGWHMPPMMSGGFGMMGFGMMLFMWLISLASLVLIGLGIAWLIKTLTAPK